MQRTIIEMLHSAAERYGDRTYTNTKTDNGWEGCSFKRTDVQSDYVAAYLLKQGFKPQQTVGILAEGKSSWVTCELGLIKARMISVPLSIKLTPQEIAFRVNHSEAVALAVSSNTLANAIKALPLFDHKVMFIYLDEQDERLEEQIKSFDWKQDVDYVPWGTLMLDGENLLEQDSAVVKNSEALIDEHDTINICYTSGDRKSVV